MKVYSTFVVITSESKWSKNAIFIVTYYTIHVRTYTIHT